MIKKYQVEMTTLAQQQILQIAQYIINEYQAPEIAYGIVEKLEHELNKLTQLPERVVLTDLEPWCSKGIRKYIMGNYIAYFKIFEEEASIRVIAVVPEKMDQSEQLTQAILYNTL